MSNENLRKLFESLGFENVRTVISSGNVLFDTPSRGAKSLESQVEKALPKKLGFSSTTIIRSKKQLQSIVDDDPFEDIDHSGKTNLNVTFLKKRTSKKLKLPYTPDDRDYTIVAMDGQTLFTVIDLTSEKTPDMMRWLEKEFGKEITTRTFKTVQRILKKFDDR